MIKVLLVDDHRLIRDAIKTYLAKVDGIEVAGEASNGKEALIFLDKNRDSVNIMLVDINMPEMNGIELTREVSKSYPAIKVIALTMIKEGQHIKQMLQAGASGYLLKNSREKEILEAIQKVCDGGTYFNQDVTQSIMMSMTRQSSPTARDIPLSAREKDVLKLIIQEYSNQEIANKLFISARTVDAHKRNLLEKTGSKNIAGLVKYAINNFLFEDI